MSYREQLDFLLAALLVLRDSDGPRWVDLQALAKALGWDNPLDVLEAARFLEGQGYIRSDIRIGGAVDAQLAPTGTMYLQDKGAGLEALTMAAADVLESHSKDEFAAGKASEHPVRADRRIAFDKIETLKTKMEELGLHHDLPGVVHELEVLKWELEKTQPNRELIDNKLHSLSALALPIGYEVSELIELLSL